MKRAHMLRSVLLCSFVLWLASPAAPPASAGQFTKLVVVGDSLSDTGNLFEATNGAIPPRPYYLGRFSNGPVWVEYLAAALDVPFEDLAYGGAKTDHGNLFDRTDPSNPPVLDFPGLADEVAFVTTAGGLDPDAVYVVWAGANDFREALLRGDIPDFQAIIGNLVSAVGALYLAGARHVVVPNLPDLGLTPEGRASGTPELLTLLSQIYNANLETALARYASAAARVDIFGIMTKVVNDPHRNGFTNVTIACLTSAGICATPDSYLFWDHVHPTTAGHALLAEKFAKTINQAFVKQHRNALR